MGPYPPVLALLVGGAVIVALGRSHLVGTNRIRARRLAREGSATARAEETDEPGQNLWAPVYRYTAEGIEYRARSGNAARPARYHVGDRIPVFVNPATPNESKVLDRSVPIFTYWLIAIGALVSAVGIVVARLALAGKFRLASVPVAISGRF